MTKYTIEITETLQKTVSVDNATTLAEAIEFVQKQYYGEELILDSDDFVNVSFSAKEVIS